MGTWTTHAATLSGSSISAATHGGLVYVFGPTTGVAAYDPGLDSFTSKVASLVSTAGAAAVTAGDYIYLFASASTTHQRYSVTGNSWSYIQSSPGSKTNPNAVADSNGDIWVFGGTGTDSTTGSVYKYSPSLNSWTTPITTGMNNYQYKGATIFNNDIYYFGGLGASSVVKTDARKIDLDTLQISSLTVLPAARRGGQVQERGGLIYYISGNSTSATSSYTSTNYAYDPDTNTWSTKTAVTAGQECVLAASAEAGTAIYIVGGIRQSSTLSAVRSWSEPAVSVGPSSSTVVVSASAGLHITGTSGVVVTSSSAGASVSFDQVIEADSFLDVIPTGSNTFDALYPETTLYPNTTLYPGGDF